MAILCLFLFLPQGTGLLLSIIGVRHYADFTLRGQVLARVLEQGSRLSAVRLAQVHAACDVLGIQRGFDENDLYSNLTWLSAHQEAI